MKRLKSLVLALLLAPSSHAVETYFPKERTDKFACQIAHSIREAYPNKSLDDLRRGILKHLREDIDPWVDAYPIPAGLSFPRPLEWVTGIPGFPMDRSEYYLQNAFILYGNPEMELKEPTESYFGSFIHLARKRHIAYLNNEAPKFQLRDETDLLDQIEDNLPSVANFTFPYKDTEGNPIQQNGHLKEGIDRYTLAIGNPEHRKYDEFISEAQRYNHFSSPLFVWLLEQDNFTISPENLFTKALEIYDDPIVALGVIPWIFSGDSLTVSRKTSSVVSYKIEQIVEGRDIPGYQYHFWGYLTQGIIGNRLRVGALAYVYEYIYQRDIPDWKVDVIALTLGQQIRKFHRTPKLCQQ